MLAEQFERHWPYAHEIQNILISISLPVFPSLSLIFLVEHKSKETNSSFQHFSVFESNKPEHSQKGFVLSRL